MKTLKEWLTENQTPDIDFLLMKTLENIEAKDWYKKSRESIQELFGQYSDMFIKILAATSQRNTVELNARFAVNAFNLIVDGFDTHGESFGLCNHIIQKQLSRIKNGEPLTGPKIGQFAAALNGDPNAIVIDVWMLRVFNIKRQSPTPCDRRNINAMIKKLSDKTGMTCSEVQACLWTYAKKELNESQFKDYSDFTVHLKNYVQELNQYGQMRGMILCENKKFEIKITWRLLIIWLLLFAAVKFTLEVLIWLLWRL